MDINQSFLDFALLGSAWVLWLLVGLSICGGTVALERFTALASAARGQQALFREAQLHLTHTSDGSEASEAALSALLTLAGRTSSSGSRLCTALAQALLAGRRRNIEPIRAAFRLRERRRLEQYISVLGTIGSNAPFVGLLGTVLEILRVFSAIGSGGLGQGQQSLAIMTGISEALVATGVGLLVAIPAVVAYNALIGRVEQVLGEAEELGESVLAIAAAQGDESPWLQQ